MKHVGTEGLALWANEFGLEEVATPPHSGSPTSRAAAHAIAPIAGTIRGEVYATIVAARGATCEELCAALHHPGNTVRPRLRELERGGYIRKSTETRPTPSGRQAVVYVTKEAA